MKSKWRVFLACHGSWTLKTLAIYVGAGLSFLYCGLKFHLISPFIQKESSDGSNGISTIHSELSSSCSENMQLNNLRDQRNPSSYTVLAQQKEMSSTGFGWMKRLHLVFPGLHLPNNSLYRRAGPVRTPPADVRGTVMQGVKSSGTEINISTTQDQSLESAGVFPETRDITLERAVLTSQWYGDTFLEYICTHWVVNYYRNCQYLFKAWSIAFAYFSGRGLESCRENRQKQLKVWCQRCS